MDRDNARQVALKAISVLIILGGIVRLFAQRDVFESFLIGALWTPHPYFAYIYRVLGAFVLFAGIVIFTIALNPSRHSDLLKVCGFCFAFIACVMLLGGLLLRMSVVHYAFDCVFCIITAWVCLSFNTQRKSIASDE
jgi:hypothetical protein